MPATARARGEPEGAATGEPETGLPMTVDAFLARRGDGSGRVWELVDGVPRAQVHASDAHGTVDTNLITQISTHLRAHRPGWRVVAKPGIRPRLATSWNHRVPELGVTRVPNVPGMRATPEPVLLVEVLSPPNRADTWSNVPLYASLPPDPGPIGPGRTIGLRSIGLDLAMADVYYATHLAEAARG